MTRSTSAAIGLAGLVAIGLAMAACLHQSALLGWTLTVWVGLVLMAALGRRFWTRRTPDGASRFQPTKPTSRDPVSRSLRIAVVSTTRRPARAWARVGREEPPILILPPEPDLGPLRAVMDQHREVYARHAERLTAQGCGLEPHQRGVSDAFAWNMDQIRPYLDDVLAREDPARLARLPEEIEGAVELLTLGPWCVGYAFLQEAPSASMLLLMARGLSIAALPVPQRDLVAPAIAHTHRLFVGIMNGYYASEWGRPARRQRDGHLIDTFSTFTRVALKSFQSGLDLSLLE